VNRLGSSLSPGDGSLAPFRQAKKHVVEAFERDYVTRLVHAYRGNITQAARAAGKERRDLGRLLKKYGLRPEQFRDIS
jgi:DNA-binding NtrC family response regulator